MIEPLGCNRSQKLPKYALISGDARQFPKVGDSVSAENSDRRDSYGIVQSERGKVYFQEGPSGDSDYLVKGSGGTVATIDPPDPQNNEQGHSFARITLVAPPDNSAMAKAGRMMPGGLAKLLETLKDANKTAEEILTSYIAALDMNEKVGVPSEEHLERLRKAFENQDRAVHTVRQWIAGANISGS